MSEVRAARVFADLNMAMHDAAVACWGAKFQYFNPRPGQLDPLIKTVIGLPNFPAYPSGHSTFSAAAPRSSPISSPTRRRRSLAMADEAGISRVYGGIHYPTDVQRGKEHGVRIGEAVVDLREVGDTVGSVTARSTNRVRGRRVVGSAHRGGGLLHRPRRVRRHRQVGLAPVLSAGRHRRVGRVVADARRGHRRYRGRTLDHREAVPRRRCST